MAGDWIKVEKATARKPEILRMADQLSIHPDQAFGLCVRFWFWCDDQLTTGHAPIVTNVTLDSVIGHAGFSTALVNVGWLRVRDGSLEVPNFDRHLSDSAKNRALSGERKKKQREGVPKMSRKDRDESVTREEKRREEKSPNHLSVVAPQEFVIPEKMQAAEVQQRAAMWFSYLEIEYPDKVLPPNSPQLEAFWFRANRMGPERFCEAVLNSVANNYASLHEPSKPSTSGPKAEFKNGKKLQEL